MNVRFVAPLLALVTLAPYALAGTGPFTGTLTQGETDWHYYDNNPKGHACIDVMASYLVEMTYTPASATLTLTAGGQSAVGSNGYAAVGLEASYCTAFEITVTGTSVSGTASYTVTVTRSVGGGYETA